MKIIKVTTILVLLLIMLTGCYEQKYSLEDKITEEIKFLESNLIKIVNNFALEKYIVSSDEESGIVNYTAEILEDTKNIEEASSRIMVDLATANVDNDEISKLSNSINNMILYVSTGNQSEYLTELSNFFSLLPNYEAQISSDSDEIFERRIKYFTVSAYISFFIGDKENSKTQIETLENEFSEKQKNVEYVKEHKYNLNKIYLLIEELKNAIESDSDELVKEKYLLLIDEI